VRDVEARQREATRHLSQYFLCYSWYLDLSLGFWSRNHHWLFWHGPHSFLQVGTMSQEHCLLGERKERWRGECLCRKKLLFRSNSVGMDWCIFMMFWIFNGKNEKKMREALCAMLLVVLLLGEFHLSPTLRT
jgi:hypothetical protein